MKLVTQRRASPVRRPRPVRAARRLLTAAELDTVRAAPDAATAAAAFGVAEKTARHWREKLILLGATAGPPAVSARTSLGPAGRDAVTASGNHTLTARELGISPSAFSRWRTRLGLPALPESEMIARRTQGLRDRWEADRELARGYGLPAGVTPRELSVLLALLGGPAGLGELAEAIGSRPSCVQRMVWAMTKAGLAASLPRDGSGRRYCLSIAAIDMIAAAGAGVPQ